MSLYINVFKIREVYVMIDNLSRITHLTYKINHLISSSFYPYINIPRVSGVGIGIEQRVSLSFENTGTESILF